MWDSLNTAYYESDVFWIEWLLSHRVIMVTYFERTLFRIGLV